MHFDFDDEEEVIQNQYFAMAAADALRRITAQRGAALCYDNYVLIADNYVLIADINIADLGRSVLNFSSNFCRACFLSV
jgi:hypothetical protein